MCFELTLWEEAHVWICLRIPSLPPSNPHSSPSQYTSMVLKGMYSSPLPMERGKKMDWFLYCSPSISFVFLLETVILLCGPNWSQTQSSWLSLPSAGIAGMYQQALFVISFLKRHTVHRSGLGPLDRVQAAGGLISMFPTELYIWEQYEHLRMSVSVHLLPDILNRQSFLERPRASYISLTKSNRGPISRIVEEGWWWRDQKGATINLAQKVATKKEKSTNRWQRQSKSDTAEQNMFHWHGKNYMTGGQNCVHSDSP